ncbi:ATP-binding cassette domain-containing protein [Marinoscillum pacificum]|uniref:ATP-binding cassette domain-containing protein n=1 Tax=Marinoscillum pacificum TaxID=392723 RepID=UPI002157B639|nr:ATP-binding cassette domain-containing protein [Marinoscillum pacificum]
MQLLEIDSVNFKYGDRSILSNVYLKVYVGEAVGFLGRNGCGKSTLLKVIFGSLKGENQSVRIDGVYHATPFESSQVMFMPQEGLFPGFLTIRKACELYQADFQQMQKHPEVLEYLEFQFDQLSGGISKFIETLIVLYSPAPFILLDEPFSFIAPVLVERLIPTIKEVAQYKGVLLTDHQYKSILATTDRLYLLRNQSIRPVTEVQELRDMGYIS